MADLDLHYQQIHNLHQLLLIQREVGEDLPPDTLVQLHISGSRGRGEEFSRAYGTTEGGAKERGQVHVGAEVVTELPGVEEETLWKSCYGTI